MNRNTKTKTAPILFVLIACLLAAPVTLAGGKSKGSKKAKKFPQVDLSGYSVLYLEDFELADPKVARAKKERKRDRAETMTRWFPDFINSNLAPETFEAVHRGPANGDQGAVILRGRILRYKPGSAAARAMMAGAGKAKLQLEIKVIDAASGDELATFPINRLWAWGGMLGASRGIEEIQQNVGYQLSRYLEQCRQGQLNARK
jgi:hypothetical protein